MEVFKYIGKLLKTKRFSVIYYDNKAYISSSIRYHVKRSSIPSSFCICIIFYPEVHEERLTQLHLSSLSWAVSQYYYTSTWYVLNLYIDHDNIFCEWPSNEVYQCSDTNLYVLLEAQRWYMDLLPFHTIH